MPEGNVIVSLDRTTWEFGKEIRNVLVLEVSWSHIGVALMMKWFSYQGACTAKD